MRNGLVLRSWEQSIPLFIYTKFVYVAFFKPFPVSILWVFNMGKPWVLPSFKQILIDSSAEYLRTNNRKKDKARTTFIQRVVSDIRKAVEGTNDPLPIDLDKVCYSPIYLSCIRTDFVSVSTHGSETRPTDTPMVTERRRRGLQHVAIPLS